MMTTRAQNEKCTYCHSAIFLQLGCFKYPFTYISIFYIIYMYTRKDGQSIDNVVFFRILCETIKDFITKVSDVGVLRGDKNLNEKCCYLKSKLSHLLDVLKDEQLLFHDPYSVIEIFFDFTISTLQTCV